MHKLATGDYATTLGELDISVGNNCTGTTCQIGDDYLLMNATNCAIAIYLNSTSSDGTKLNIVLVYDADIYNDKASFPNTVKKGQFICADRGVNRFRAACQSFSSDDVDHAGGKYWLF
jgi:hypothetical protein